MSLVIPPVAYPNRYSSESEARQKRATERSPLERALGLWERQSTPCLVSPMWIRGARERHRRRTTGARAGLLHPFGRSSVTSSPGVHGERLPKSEWATVRNGTIKKIAMAK